SVLWQKGIPSGTLLNTAASGTQVYATNLSGDYTDSTTAYLVSECYDLNTLTNPFLKFNMAFDLEFDWDIAYMEYSVDNGTTWEVLGTANDPNWYNSSRFNGDGLGNNCYNCIGGQWTGTDTTIKEYSYDLTSFSSESSIMFRFVLLSDTSVTNEGAIVDDFVIDGTLSTSEFNEGQFKVYPNPSNDIFNVRINNTFQDITFNVFDVTGKSVLKIEDVTPNQSNYSLNMQGYSSGIYFLKIKTEIGETTKKLILN
ncbi:MAG: T9SS type A sorting domain-containing protein, partial [Flavobacteriaceae bacterium]|nr:T9SS type A sorting domain-containing protein [Flavobacteriaceae bacterium]